MSVPEIISVAIIVLLVVVAIYLNPKRKSSGKAYRVALKKQAKRLQPLYDKCHAGQLPTQLEVYEYAKNKLTRELTFLLLQNQRLTELFPNEFYSIEKAAESNLVNWLEFPTELGVPPNEIEHLKKVPVYFDGRFVYYHVYKFKAYQPHWAANAGWMLGVVGPYTDASKPYDHPNSTFSRLHRSLDVSCPEEEARWVHYNILLKVMKATRSRTMSASH